MLDIYFIKADGNVNTIEVSELEYQELYNIGISKVIRYKERKLTVEGEEDTVLCVQLGKVNRNKFFKLIDKEIHNNLNKMLKQLPIDPTIKEIRESTRFLEILQTIYNELEDFENKYFSYE